MKITKQQLEAVKQSVINAVKYRAMAWDAERYIELELGRDSDCLSEACGDAAFSVDETDNFTMTDQEVREVLESAYAE